MCWYNELLSVIVFNIRIYVKKFSKDNIKIDKSVVKNSLLLWKMVK